jgi:hypothetical protein
MDYVKSRQLGNQLKNLDAALARGDRIGIMIAVQSIDNLLRSSDIGSPEPGLPGIIPKWIQQVIRDQGVKLPALEKAVGARTIVIKPTFGGSRFGIELKGTF